MKKIILPLIIISLFVSTGMVSAAKPDENKAGAQKINWNLSGAVMPVPPYGSGDIIGSDIASKLIVNQPNGKVGATITGAMNGLTPNTTYTVYLSKGYDKYIPLNIIGTYKWMVLDTYEHDMVIEHQDSDGTFTGHGGYPAGGHPYLTTETITGQVTGNQITFTTTYGSEPYNPGYVANVSGTIASNGTMSGTSPWEWHTTVGHVTLASGPTGWPGLLNTVQPFTFTTNDSGSGSWHLNLKSNDITAVSSFSVWINGNGGTILISENITIK